MHTYKIFVLFPHCDTLIFILFIAHMASMTWRGPASVGELYLIGVKYVSYLKTPGHGAQYQSVISHKFLPRRSALIPSPCKHGSGRPSPTPLLPHSLPPSAVPYPAGQHDCHGSGPQG